MAFRQNGKKKGGNILVFSEKHCQISKKEKLIFFHHTRILILVW
jgi:hypothetical protein